MCHSSVADHLRVISTMELHGCPPSLQGCSKSYVIVSVRILHQEEWSLLWSKTIFWWSSWFLQKGEASLTTAFLTLITVFSSCQQSPMDATINSPDKDRWTANTSELKGEEKRDMKLRKKKAYNENEPNLWLSVDTLASSSSHQLCFVFLLLCAQVAASSENWQIHGAPLALLQQHLSLAAKPFFYFSGETFQHY